MLQRLSSKLVKRGLTTLEEDLPWVSPEMYSGDDYSCITQAFTTAKNMGVAVKLSRIYDCTGNVSVSNFYSDIFGESMATCGLRFSAGFGIIIDNSGTTVVRKPVGLRNFTIKATGKRQGTALEFLGTGGIAYARQLIVRDLDVSNDAGTPTSFDVVFKLSRAGQCLFDGVNVAGGGTSDPNARMGKIFDLYSTKNLNVVNGSYQNFDTFMYAQDDSEGVVVFGNHIIAGRRGVVSENNVGNLFQVTNNHFNTTLSAVELGDLSNNGGNHSIITDNFCMVWNGIPEDAAAPYIGFKSCAQYGVFHNNEVLLSGFTKDVTHTVFGSNAAGTRTAQYNTVSDSRVNNCSRGIHLKAGTQNNHVSNIQRVGVSLVNVIIDEGTNNRCWIFDTDNNTFMTPDIKLASFKGAGARQIRFYSSDDMVVPSGILRVSGGTAGVQHDGVMEATAKLFAVKDIRPSAANTYNCGAASFPWKGGYTSTAFQITSDRDAKMEEQDIPDDILDAWGSVNYVLYKLKSSVKEKGDSARKHVGVIAQDIRSAFEAKGVDPFELGILCYDDLPSEPPEFDEEGLMTREGVPAHKGYTVRYEELLCLEVAYSRRKMQALEERLAKLEAILAAHNDIDTGKRA